jgi:hypothetical protein
MGPGGGGGVSDVWSHPRKVSKIASNSPKCSNVPGYWNTELVLHEILFLD